MPSATPSGRKFSVSISGPTRNRTRNTSLEARDDVRFTIEPRTSLHAGEIRANHGVTEGTEERQSVKVNDDEHRNVCIRGSSIPSLPYTLLLSNCLSLFSVTLWLSFSSSCPYLDWEKWTSWESNPSHRSCKDQSPPTAWKPVFCQFSVITTESQRAQSRMIKTCDQT